MSQWIGFTNKKLYQCRLLLAEYAQCDDPSLADALEEGGLYQLHDAWLSYLQELGDMVAFREPVSSLQDLLQRVSLVTGEMRELTQLADDPFSWLSQMLKAVAALRQPSAVRPAQSSDAQSIALTAESTESPVVRWWAAMTALIDVQRENRQES
ncbi:MAG: hypothetical protein CMI02_11110 [Oceanospirillaceae bacterium]|nr:hypothetical protein [Oceanospirillaceae bacterium]MBT12569.1 hypothetical protein [Oceanospirillaceae bacterium]|tara:strand:+ start:670 stop:1131 length:462 start_codon:yes stop_codon:yes gene_type:complete